MNNYFSSSRTISILLAISIGWSAPAFSNDVKWEQHHESEVAGFALRFGWQSVITNDSSLDTPDKVLRFHRNKLREYMAAQEQGDQYRNLILLSFLTAAHNYKNLPENKRLYSMAKEKYQIMIEEYPLVKALKERIRLELDY